MLSFYSVGEVGGVGKPTEEKKLDENTINGE